MALDTSYYTTPETLSITLDSSNSIDVMAPYFGPPSTTYPYSKNMMCLKAVIDSDVLNADINMSFAYCAMDNHSPTSNAIAFTGVSNNSEVRELFFSVPDDFNTLAFCCYGNASYKYDYISGQGGTNTPWAYDYTHNTYTTGGATLSRVHGGSMIPITKFAMQNFCLIPCVVAYKYFDVFNINTQSDLPPVTDRIVCDLNYYFNYYDTTLQKYAYEIYPIITNYIVVYHGVKNNGGNFVLKSPSDVVFSPCFLDTQSVLVGEERRFTEYGNVAGGYTTVTSLNYNNTTSTVSNQYYTVIGGIQHTSTFDLTTQSNTPSIAYVCRMSNIFNVKWYKHNTTSTYDRAFSYFEYDNTTHKELLMRTVAYFGMFFKLSFDNTDFSFTSPNTYLGIIDDNGVTHGDYSHGADNANQNNFNWTDPINDTKYNPYDKPISDNDKGDLTTHLHSGSYETTAIYYATTAQNIRSLMDYVNTYSPDETTLSEDFKGVNPSEYIINALYFPFDVQYSGADNIIYISTLNSGAYGLKFSPTYGTTIYDFGSVYIERLYNDFRDFAPYTKLEINAPFANSIELDISKFYNHYINIKMCVDFTTGDCITLIFRDDLLYDTVTGNCAVQLPVSALAMGTYQDTINSLTSQSKINETQKESNDILTITNTGVSLAGMAVSYGASSLIANPVNTLVSGTANRDVLSEQGKRIDYSLSHTAPSPVKISGGTSNSMMMLEHLPRYTITRCKMLNSEFDFESYGKTVGFATVENGKVSDFSGLTVCSDMQFNSISATQAEINDIKNQFYRGVVL